MRYPAIPQFLQSAGLRFYIRQVFVWLGCLLVFANATAFSQSGRKPKRSPEPVVRKDNPPTPRIEAEPEAPPEKANEEAPRLQATISSDGADLLGFLKKPPAIEYGRTEDLKGVERVFVYTSLQISERENVMREIRKRAPQLNFTDQPDEADVYLVFGTVEERELIRPAGPEEIIVDEEPKKDRKKKEEGQPEKKAGEKEEKKNKSDRRKTTVIRHRGPEYQELINGRGFVFKRLGEDRVRLVMEFKDTKQKRSPFERNPSTNFARKFVEALRAANNLK